MAENVKIARQNIGLSIYMNCPDYMEERIDVKEKRKAHKLFKKWR